MHARNHTDMLTLTCKRARAHTHTHTHTHTQSLYISPPSTGVSWYIIHFAPEASVTRCMESEPWIDELLLFQHSLWFQVIPGRRRLGRCRKNCQRKKPSPSLWQRWMKWHVSLNDFVWCVYEWVCGCLCLSCMSVVFCLVFCCLSRLSPFDNCWLCACNTVFFCWLWNTLL